MSNETLKGRFQHPMYTAAALTAANPVLLAGEVVYESDTGRHKIGDGVKAWSALPYAGGGNFEGNITADRVTQDSGHRFVSDAEKLKWNDKADNDLANVTLAKLLSTNGYYKAPDGLMLQWGVQNGNSTGLHTVYYPTGFYSVVPITITTPVSGDNSFTGSVSCYISAKSTSYFKAAVNWKDGSGQGRSAWSFHWLAIGRWK